MTRVSQNARISEINKNLIQMANLVEKQIMSSMQALKTNDIALSEKIIKQDDMVDDFQRIIEEECIIFIATEQPLAKDLRNVFTATKIVTDLERMADYAVDIAKIIKKNKCEIEAFSKSISLWDMEELVRKMIDESLNAFIERDEDKALEICKMDDKVDALYKSIFKEILQAIKNDEANIEEIANLLFVAKYLERIGDRVTNICEGVIFVKKGKYVDLNE